MPSEPSAINDTSASDLGEQSLNGAKWLGHHVLPVPPQSGVEEAGHDGIHDHELKQYPQRGHSWETADLSEPDTDSFSQPEFHNTEHKVPSAKPGPRDHSSAASDTKQRQGVASRMLGRLQSSSSNSGVTKSSTHLLDEMQSDPRIAEAIEKNALAASTAASTNPEIGKADDYKREALHLIRTFSHGNVDTDLSFNSTSENAPNEKYYYDYDYIPTPREYKPSVGALLSSRLNALYDGRSSDSQPNKASKSRTFLLGKHSPMDKRARSVESATTSGTATPNRKVKWHQKPDHSSVSNLLVQTGLATSGPGLPESTSALHQQRRRGAPFSGGMASTTDLEKGLTSRHVNLEGLGSSEETLVDEIADIIARRKYLTRLCAVLMKYGAPTHRMEEYLIASARALEIDAEFLHIPGAMVCTFIDHSIYANNVEVVRKDAGLDLGRLQDAFNVYKNVIHRKSGAQEAIAEFDEIEKRKDEHGDLFAIFMFGLASVVVGPSVFNARPIDFAPIFVLGCALGFMQIKVVPRSNQFSNVFEVFACVLIACISRALGTIQWHDGTYVFCFSAVSQSSIAMILPGFLVLNAALELQGKNMVAGSVRMVYAIIYVLFLGFGLLIGTTIFGFIKHDAVSDVTCKVPEWFRPGISYKLIYTKFIWAPIFAACMALIHNAKWSQLGVMALIATAGHQAYFWMSTQLPSNLQVANAIGAFTIGCIANLYSRLFHGLAAAAMLPAVSILVPGGLAASGSLVAGIDSSNQIIGNDSAISVINNGTSGFVAAQNNPNSVYGGTIYNAGYGMVQVAIGISVGLYLSALVVYPFGKRRSGLSSF